MRQTIGLLLKGILIGLANIIPGVSGGTMALVLGIYDRLIRAIGRLGPTTVRRLGAALRTPPRGRSIVALLREHDVGFLSVLLLGALTAIVATSKLMEMLYTEHHDPTYGFFLGLIAASIVVPWGMIGRRSWPELLSGLVAVVLVVAMTEAVSPKSKLEAARAKVAAHEARAAAGAGAETDEEVDHSAQRLALLALCGAAAISAMILPGVSGSFLLLVLGVYFEILGAVNRRDLLTLAAFAAGCAVGLALFARLLGWLLARFRSQTMAFLVGLMVGSLWSIWPFKSHETVGGKRIDLANAWPGGVGANEIATVVAALVGVAIVVAFLRYERRTAAAGGA